MYAYICIPNDIWSNEISKESVRGPLARPDVDGVEVVSPNVMGVAVSFSTRNLFRTGSSLVESLCVVATGKFDPDATDGVLLSLTERDDTCPKLPRFFAWLLILC